tara:strand:- start:285 stop:500 length:216 start_codon:yes stop_codon:yes gene_type:complete
MEQLTKFKDFDPAKIAAKLKQVEEFEAKYGSNDMTKAWYKWCTSYEYRKKEWEWRQGLAKAHEEICTKKRY